MVEKTVFREPDGTRTGVLLAFIGVLTLGVAFYASDGSTDLAFGLISGLSITAMSVPEFLPAEHQFFAGLLRTTFGTCGIVAMFALIVSVL